MYRNDMLLLFVSPCYQTLMLDPREVCIIFLTVAGHSLRLFGFLLSNMQLELDDAWRQPPVRCVLTADVNVSV